MGTVIAGGEKWPTPVEAIVQAFNTWAYKREQPSDLALTKRVVARAVERNEPVPLLLYWGKGPRSTMAEPDVKCLDFLVSMRCRIEAVYPKGAQFHLLLTDTHARLNNHADQEITHYFGEIAAAARARGFACRRLSEVIAAATHHVQFTRTEAPETELIENLTRSAAKWYFGAKSTIEAATAYYAMNMREKLAVETIFPNAIFVTFSSSSLRSLFPAHLPIFYMYTLRKGFGVKPWFIADECEQSGRLAMQHHAPLELAACK